MTLAVAHGADDMRDHGSAPTELLNGKLVRIVLGFMFIGPPVGGLTILIANLFFHLFSPEHTQAAGAFGWSIETALGVFVFIIFFSYVLGAAPAAVAGLVLGFLQIRYGRTPWYVALACGVVVGVGYASYFYFIPRQFGASPSAGTNAGLVLICVIPTFVCWIIMRRWYER
jgi:hypothetical protein